MALVDPSRAAFVQEEFRAAVWKSQVVRDQYGKVARDTKDEAIVTFFDNVADAQVIVNERGAIMGAHGRRFRLLVDAILTEDDLQFATALPGARLIDEELVADMDVAVVAIESVDFGAEQTTLLVWGVVGAAPIPDAQATAAVGVAGGYGAATATSSAMANANANGSAAGFGTGVGVGQRTAQAAGAAAGYCTPTATGATVAQTTITSAVGAASGSGGVGATGGTASLAANEVTYEGSGVTYLGDPVTYSAGGTADSSSTTSDNSTLTADKA